MTKQQDIGVTEAIAEFTHDSDVSTAPAEAWDLARRAVVDTVGVAIAARRDPGFQTLLETMSPELPDGSATVLATRERTSAAAAALLNGGGGHALDFDDVADQMYGHPSVVLVPTVLAVAEAEGAGGRDVLEGYMVGFDVICAIAAGMDIRAHYAHGWHSTATIGVLGATAAAARICRLDPARTRHALGLAASMAGGSRQNFGSMTKPLHPGLAARDAVLATNLARNGFTADPSQLEAPLGFFAMYGHSVELASVLDALSTPGALAKYGINVKKYPCCYNTHRTADVILKLVQENDLRPEQISAIRLTLEPRGYDPLIHRRPSTGLQAKFSPEYVLAAAILDRKVTLSSFLDDAVRRPEAQRLGGLVTREESAVPPFGPQGWEYAYAAVEVETTGGDVLRDRADVARGDAGAPLTRSELEAKFRDCLEFSETGWDTDRLLAELWQIDEQGEPDLLNLRA